MNYNEELHSCLECIDCVDSRCEFLGGAKIADPDAEFVCIYFVDKQQEGFYG